MREINNSWLVNRALLILVILISPLVENKLISPRDRFSKGTDHNQVLKFYESEIYSSEGEVDFLFLGSSGIRTALDAFRVEKVFEYLYKDRAVTVLNFGHDYPGVDLDYFLLKEVIKNRGVKKVIISLDAVPQVVPHRYMRDIWDPNVRPSDQPWSVYWFLYADKIIQSWSRVIKSPDDSEISIGHLSRHRGSISRDLGYTEDEDSVGVKETFKRVQKTPRGWSFDDLRIDLNDSRLLEVGKYEEFDEYYFGKICEVLKTNDIEFYFLFTPTIRIHGDINRIPYLRSEACKEMSRNYVGLSPAEWFNTQNVEEMKPFFYNAFHLNSNGAEYFTNTLIPILVDLYEKE